MVLNECKSAAILYDAIIKTNPNCAPVQNKCPYISKGTSTQPCTKSADYEKFIKIIVKDLSFSSAEKDSLVNYVADIADNSYDTTTFLERELLDIDDNTMSDLILNIVANEQGE